MKEVKAIESYESCEIENLDLFGGRVIISDFTDL